MATPRALVSDTTKFDLARFSPSRGRRRKGREVADDLSLRHRYVVELYMNGLPREEIEDLTGYSSQTISQIVNHPRAIAYKQQIMKNYDSDFQALYASVIKTVRENLQPDVAPAVRNEAAKIWLRAHGKIEPEGGVAGAGGQNNFSAEQIVVNILQQAQQEKAEVEFHSRTRSVPQGRQLTNG